jgi:hypothetical protein
MAMPNSTRLNQVHTDAVGDAWKQYTDFNGLMINYQIHQSLQADLTIIENDISFENEESKHLAAPFIGF